MAQSAAGPSTMSNIENLLFKATNPANKLEDVNTIKQFCDAVNATPDGPAIACRILAHKIQSPQEREAVQALAVLEACAKSCGPSFQTEIGKFKFLNEMIKLVSPRYLAGRTPEHIKKKVIELLYVWSKDSNAESKVVEAYSMLKRQGIVKEDPVYVGGAVFAAALPPRNDGVMSPEQQTELRKLLQSKNPEDLQRANKIIRNMVQEDERKMDALTRRATELTMVNNNSKLLNEMLDHYDKNASGKEEKELLKELFQSCEKMQPKLFRLAAESDEHDDGIGEILQASDDIARVMDRYKMVIIQNKPDISRPLCKQNSDQLLDLDLGLTTSDSGAKDAEKSIAETCLDDVMIGLGSVEMNDKPSDVKTTETLIAQDPESNDVFASATPQTAAPTIKTTSIFSIDDLLNNATETLSTPPMVLPTSTSPMTSSAPVQMSKFEESRQSRIRGLDELDLLGETALRAHLPQKSPQFAKKAEKLSMNMLQKKKSEFPKPDSPKLDNSKPFFENSLSKPAPAADIPLTDVSKPLEQPIQSLPEPKQATSVVEDVKIADLFVPLTSIKPGSVPPLTLQESSEGISIVLHFGKDAPRDHVTAVVVTIISKLKEAISEFELKAVVPKGCKVKLQPPSSNQLPAHNPFVPPSAITQVMLIANPQKKDVSLKYVISYVVDGEPQTEMGQVDKLPI